MKNNNTHWLKENINTRGIVYMNKKHNTRKMTTPSRTEQLKLVKDLNEVALYLYTAYIDKAYMPGIDLLDDSKIGRSIGWTARKVKDNRLKLQKAGWIHFSKNIINGITFATWALGKDKVQEYLTYGNEFTKVSTISTNDGVSLSVSAEPYSDDSQVTRSIDPHLFD
jgi:hypothetical protein